jgi:predicted 3-demethylubiquinone-9 3-methyltransferase (glyoxalase superfamily)
LIADGGEESNCGWLKDKFGLSWQVVPTALGRYLSDPDRKKADRAMQAMMKMRKIIRRPRQGLCRLIRASPALTTHQSVGAQ